MHQGDGTGGSLTAGRTDIFTLSLHAEKNFPVRKARSSRDVGLPDGVDDDGFMEALTPHLPEVLRRLSRPIFGALIRPVSIPTYREQAGSARADRCRAGGARQVRWSPKPAAGA